MALDTWINSSLAKLNSMLTPTSVLPNRSLNELLQLAWANKVVPQQAAIVNSTPQQVVQAPTVQQPQYIANAFTPQWLTWQFLNTSNATADLFADYERAINPYLQDYNKNSFALWNDIISQLNAQKTNYLNQFWPQWTIQKQLDDYYAWLWAYNASQQAAQQALQSNEALRATWSSAAANLAWQKVSDDFANKVNEAAKQRLDEQTKIYQQLNNYLNQFTTQYANTKDKYVLWTYKNLFDLKNQLAWQILQQQNALLSAQLTKNTTPTATAWTATAAKTTNPVKQKTEADKLVETLRNNKQDKWVDALTLLQNMRKSWYSSPVYTTNKNAPWASKTPVNIKSWGKIVTWYKVW